MGWTLTSLIEFVTELIASTIPIALALALLAFLWSIFRGFSNSDDSKKRAELKQSLIWTLLALFIVVTLAGIVSVLTSTFDL